MSQQRQRGYATSLIITSMLVALMSVGGMWGEAYGQSAGPPPTPEAGAGAAAPIVGGAEGEAAPPAVAGEEGEAAAPARQEAVAGEEAQAAPSQLDQTGAEGTLQWSLLYTGIIVFAAGALIFMRTRRTL